MRKLVMDDTPNMSKKPSSDLNLYLVVRSVLSLQVLPSTDVLHSPGMTQSTSRTFFAIPVA